MRKEKQPRLLAGSSTLVLLAFLIIATCQVTAYYGPSRISVERTWTIDAAENSEVEFWGSLVANDSNQLVTTIMTTPPAPAVTINQKGDGGLQVSYNGTTASDHLDIRGNAIVDVDYETHILRDVPIPQTTRNFTNLTVPDAGIRAQAQKLADNNSALMTIRNIAAWVHKNMEYDMAYWGKTVPATSVFVTKRGVCVEYTHLFISMVRSLGFDTRYVGGYAFSNAWQPHAWAEVFLPGHGWIPVDPTFGQVGALDSTHVVIARGADQSEIYDMMLSSDQHAELDAVDEVREVKLTEDTEGIEADISFDQVTKAIAVTLTNTRPEYVYGRYDFLIDEAYGSTEHDIILLKPSEAVHKYYGLNRSMFEKGYEYRIPIMVEINDVKEEKTIVVSGGEAKKDNAGIESDADDAENETRNWKQETNNLPCTGSAMVIGGTVIVSGIIRRASRPH